jgi:hypothetical protein
MQPLQWLTRLLRRNGPQHKPEAISQPIPQVTPDDVERVVCRDFAAAEYAMVTGMLGEYGTEKRHREPTRVRLAALKVANGSVQKLRLCIDAAKRDYRDALAAAEFPAYHKIAYRALKLPENEQRRIIESDWRQYEEWLGR